MFFSHLPLLHFVAVVIVVVVVVVVVVAAASCHCFWQLWQERNEEK
jgi:hypothetical protein